MSSQQQMIDGGDTISKIKYLKLISENERLTQDIARIAQQLPRLRQLIEYSADAVILHDADGIIVDCNQRAAEMLAMERDDVYEEKLTHFLGDLPQIMFEQCDAKPEGTRDKFIGALLRHDDVSVPVEIHITAFSSNGERLYVSSIRDISDRLQQESDLSESQNKLSLANVELSRANSRLSHMATLKDQFLANMSHELRTPLNAVMGLSEALQEEVYGSLTDKQRESLQTIYHSGQHLLELINDVLDLSKIEADKMELQFESTNLEDLSRQCLPLVKPQATDKEQTLHFSVSGDVGQINADPRRIKQVLINLLSNAIKFTPGGGDIGIKIVANEQESTVSIAVWDTGKGIPEEQLEILFEPFVQLERHFVREHEGTGLGLALVSRLVEMHGGHIELKSNVDEGSRFTIILPMNVGGCITETQLLMDSDSDVTGLTALDAVDGMEKVATNTRVLIVEDTEDCVSHVKHYLEKIGYQVDVAVNGLDGVDKATVLLPDITLMDIQMPGIDGFEAIRRLRANERTKNLHIIATTALAMEKDKQRCFDAGADAYLSKPLSLKTLGAMISEICLNRKVKG
jgi:PAS domain S-box-containing protein